MVQCGLTGEEKKRKYKEKETLEIMSNVLKYLKVETNCEKRHCWIRVVLGDLL